jgi:hypothetical protein
MGVATWIPVVVAFLGAFLILRFLPPHHLEPAPEPGAEHEAAETPAPVSEPRSVALRCVALWCGRGAPGLSESGDTRLGRFGG